MKSYSDKVVRQRDLCVRRISEIDGLEVQSAGGAFYMFVRLTDDKWSNNDKEFVLQLLHEEHVLVVHGSGFSPEHGAGHFRIVFLPDVDVLDEAFNRIERFLTRHREV
jgi:aspartate/methionine/tyrosine aminotransferase